jgi:LEA14-like dessication related protein
MSPRPFVLAAALTAATAVSACSKPAPPTLTPKQVRVTTVSLGGVGVVVDLDAFNPNAVALTVQRVSGTVTIEGKYRLGAVASDRPVSLPPKATTQVEAPLDAKWQDLAALTALAGQPGPVHFDLTGTATVGGSRLNVDLPFSIKGTITHEQLVAATVRSIPKIPGFN